MRALTEKSLIMLPRQVLDAQGRKLSRRNIDAFQMETRSVRKQRNAWWLCEPRLLCPGGTLWQSACAGHPLIQF